MAPATFTGSGDLRAGGRGHIRGDGRSMSSRRYGQVRSGRLVMLDRLAWRLGWGHANAMDRQDQDRAS